MQTVRIQSASNENYKRWKRLADSPRAIRKFGSTLAEGAHLAECALQARVSIRSVLLCEKSCTDEALALAHAIAEKTDATLYVLSDDLYDAVSPVEHGVGLTIELVPPSTTFPEIALPVDALYMDGLQDAGNVGTLLRSALASGIRHVALSAKCATVWSSKVLRAAMGAHFALTIYENVEAKDLERLFAARRLAADARGGHDIFTSQHWEEGNTVWLFGAEGPGLSEAALAVADERFLIDIEPECESLNVAAAAAVCLFEQRRRRRSS